MLRPLIVAFFLLLISGCSTRDDDGGVTLPSNMGENNVVPRIETPTETTNTAPTPQISLAGISADFERFMTDNRLVGAQVAITRNEKLVFLESFGLADREESRPVTQNTLFRIASISKPITLLALSKLINEGKLQLNATVFGPNSLLGTSFGNLPYEPEELAITLDDLVEHKAGFSDDPDDVLFSDNGLSLDVLIARVLDERSLSSPPGTTFQYSNFGYALLGKIIENASGMDYETYVRQNILEPIDINDMYIAKQKLEERRPNEAIYYSSASSPYAIDTPRMASSFGWAASAATLAWIAVKTDGRFSENDLLAPNTGISYLNRGSWTHNGALPGTTAILKVGHPFSYVVLTNSGGANFPVVIDALHNFMEKAIEQQSEWPNTNLFQPNK
jgi:CubicO group peptidase (beta-lactamase class C family)